MKPSLLLLLCAGWLGAPWLALAQTPAAPTASVAATAAVSPSALQVRVWAATCMSCHGFNGRAQPGMASLAGMSGDGIATAMRDFKTGRRPASVMHHHARGYSEAQIVAIAHYFAALPR